MWLVLKDNDDDLDDDLDMPSIGPFLVADFIYIYTPFLFLVIMSVYCPSKLHYPELK